MLPIESSLDSAAAPLAIPEGFQPAKAIPLLTSLPAAAAALLPRLQSSRARSKRAITSSINEFESGRRTSSSKSDVLHSRGLEVLRKFANSVTKRQVVVAAFTLPPRE